MPKFSIFEYLVTRMIAFNLDDLIDLIIYFNCFTLMPHASHKEYKESVPYVAQLFSSCSKSYVIGTINLNLVPYSLEVTWV